MLPLSLVLVVMVQVLEHSQLLVEIRNSGHWHFSAEQAPAKRLSLIQLLDMEVLQQRFSQLV